MSNFIDGPYNIVRLEGKVNNINKVLYVMFDIHISLYQQKECEDIKSKNIVKYLIEQFDTIENNNNKRIDFFVEIDAMKTDFIPNYTMIYINQIQRMFEKLSGSYKNILFHYYDIRLYIKLNVNEIMNEIFRLINYSNNIILKKELFNMHDGFNIIKKHLFFLKDIIDDDKKKTIQPNILSKIYNTSYNELNIDDKLNIIILIINKIKFKYNDKHIQTYIYHEIKKLNKEIDYIIKKINNIQKNLKEYIENYDKYSENYNIEKKDKYFNFNYNNFNNIFKNLENKTTIIFQGLTIFFSNIIDLFFLRRFLDKNYIKNAIIYSGGGHCENIIKKLVTDFNFKVTHASYGYNKNINSSIKDSKDLKDLIKIFTPKKLNQCSNIKDFPKYFE